MIAKVGITELIVVAANMLLYAASISGIIFLAKWIFRQRSPSAKALSVQIEQDALRRLFEQMRKVEQRLENLETILLEKDAARK